MKNFLICFTPNSIGEDFLSDREVSIKATDSEDAIKAAALILGLEKDFYEVHTVKQE